MKQRTPTDKTATERQARFTAQRKAEGYTRRTIWIKETDWQKGKQDAIDGKDGQPPKDCHAPSYFDGYINAMAQIDQEQRAEPTSSTQTAIATPKATPIQWEDSTPENNEYQRKSFEKGYIQGLHGHGPLPFPNDVHVASWWIGNLAGISKSLGRFNPEEETD